MADKSIARRIGEAVTQGMMAMGQGMTGQPFLTGYLQNQQKNKEVEYENQLRQLQIQKIGQELDQRKKFQDWLMSQGQGNPGGIPPIGQVGNGLGMTGFSVGADGMPTIQFGQTPEAKRIEQRQALADKSIQEEEAKYRSGNALIDQIQEKWLRTNPTRVTNNGKFSTMGTIKALQSPIYGVEQWLGSRIGITQNQRSDKAYIKFVNSLRSRLAKGTIGTDVGNLSEYEQRVVTEGVPSGIWDSYEQGNEIISNLKDVLRTMKQARVDGYKNLDEKLKKEGKVLDSANAQIYLQKANGDKNRARTLALRDGWYF